MRIVITGANGFLGRKLLYRLLDEGALAGPRGEARPIGEILLFDQDTPPIPEHSGSIWVQSQSGDIADPQALAQLLADGADLVFHLAAVVSAHAEEDFELGMTVNFDGTRQLLETCRRYCPGARLIFASSVAVYGGDLPAVITDSQAVVPQNSYGVQKVMGELLVQDYSRRGFIDGCSLRLPTVVVRPGKPNKAASTFASSIIREPLQGYEAICPVLPDTAMFVSSPRQVVDNFIHASRLEGAAFGRNRSLMLPGLTVCMADMLAALAEVAGAETVARVQYQADERIHRIIAGWPARFHTARAQTLGFQADQSFSDIIRAFMTDELGLPVAG